VKDIENRPNSESKISGQKETQKELFHRLDNLKNSFEVESM
jgi:hypothetical protein